MNVTECIQQDYLEWQRGDIITISAGTGKGKSHFIKNTLYDYAKSKGKRILFFLHRTNTIEQFEAEIAAEGKSDVIELITYQSFEKAIIHQNQLDLWMYEFIICDEYHYFGNDSLFNKYTDLSLNEIIKGADERVVVLMSATNEFIKEYLHNRKLITPKEYVLQSNYDYVRTLEFYEDDQLIIDGLKKRVAKGEKALIFIESANDCYELYKQFEEHSMFICGKSHSKHKYVDEEKRKQLLKNQRFEELFLFTTQTLDAGLNIIDDDLHFIIVDISDPDVLVQCVGRKRIRDVEKDYVHLVVKNRSNGRLGHDKGNLTTRMKHAKFLDEHSQEEYDRVFYREPDPYQLVYYEPLPNGLYKIGVNQLLCDSYKYKYKRLESIQEMAGGYRQYIVELFGKEGSVSMDAYLEPQTRSALEEAHSQELVFYSQKEKWAFAEKLNLKVNGRIITSFRKINELLTIKETSYRIFPHDAKKDGKRYKTAWRIIQMLK
ncbi:DEAD/DEAH box helicase family protein [Lysinibacillus xylanilyticus]|uniref:DEAD/DEAH box helicase family protein n=1 Tax=Lysinibacillus xylanilyticus TaxID=582475 RepID=UPI003CFF460C